MGIVVQSAGDDLPAQEVFMERDEVQVLSDRVRSVERQLRVALAGWLLSVVALAIFWVGTPHASSQTDIQGTIRARGFNVYDASNRHRLGIGMSNDGNPGIWLYDGTNKTRVHVGVDGGLRPEVWFADEAGTVRLRVGTNGNGDPGIWIYGANGKSVTWSAPGGMFWSVKP
jgi:hypothetical protein